MKINGYILAICSFLIWGFFPIFWKLLTHFSAFELTAYRIIWSFLTLFFFLTFKVSLIPTIRDFLTGKVFLIHQVSTILIGINWLLFIYAVNSENILQASFGYFLGPLFTVLIGIFFLNEKTNPLKNISIILLFIAVGIRAFNISEFPWIAITLGLSFSLYGLVRKFINVSSVQSITYETFLLFFPSLFYIFYIESNGKGNYLSASGVEHLLLMLSGILTITPLIFFSAGVKRIPLTHLGFIQYLAPTLQFLCAVFIYEENMDSNLWISFIIIWVACLTLIYNARFSKSA